MATTVTCFCGKTFPAPGDMSGDYVYCPRCGGVVYVPYPLPTSQVRHHAPGGLGCLLKGLGVLVVLFLLAALLLPSLGDARPAARRAQCVNNLKQMALAMHNYHANHGCFPPAATYDRAGQPLLSWRVLILPYVECEDLYQQFHLDEPWNSPHNGALLSQRPNVFWCPSEPGLPRDRTTYQVVVGPHTMFPARGPGVRLADVTDGTSKTITVVESTRTVPWSAPGDIPAILGVPGMGLGSHHPGGFNAGFADGSIKFIKQQWTPPRVIEALLTRDGHETISSDEF